MKYTVVGTAGHVDHGKTMLVKALTGTDTDRLKEEKERGISIELGFASMDLPGGRVLAFVDVPGHEKFIRQMLAGAGGIDLLLLTVAADEGVKPQTREHLYIADLLGIEHGVVALTKVDAVTHDRLSQVEDEVRNLLSETSMKESPIIRVSALTGEGLDHLTAVLEEKAAEVPRKPVGGGVRMPVDRVFSLKGTGTVLTGTLWSGTVRIDDRLEIIPAGKKFRVRGVHVHGKSVDQASAGMRAAVNAAWIEREEIERGCIVQTPGFLQAGTRADLLIRLLPVVSRPLNNGQRVRFHHGTAEIFGRIILLDREALDPGGRAFGQIILEKPTAALRGDRFIIRTYSPQQTIAGGTIIGLPAPRRKREARSVENIRISHSGTPGDVIAAAMDDRDIQFMSMEEAAGLLGVSGEELCRVVEKNNHLMVLSSSGGQLVVHRRKYLELVSAVQKELMAYHRKYPFRSGMSREELRSALFPGYGRGEYAAFLGAMEKDGAISADDRSVRLADFQPASDAKHKMKIQQVQDRLLTNQFQPVRWSLIVKELFFFNSREGEEVLQYLESRGLVVRVDEDLYFHTEAVKKAKSLIREYLHQHNSITVAEARDLLQSSRKFVVPLMEFLDATGLTLREGEKRVLKEDNR